MISFGATATLQGNVSAPSSTPSVRWKSYSGPGAVTFGTASQASTTASFSLPGTYILVLSADDGVHAVAYDAATINVVLTAEGVISADDFLVRFPTLAGRMYRVEWSADLASNSWEIFGNSFVGNGGPMEIADSGALSLPRRCNGGVSRT